MLPPAHRLRRASDFSSVVRRGRRVGGRLIVVHADRGDAQATRPVVGASGGPARVGFVVSRAVGGSVVRNRVSRRLRAEVHHRLSCLPGGSRTVIRALPASAGATSAQLARELDRAFGRLGAARIPAAGADA